MGYVVGRQLIRTHFWKLVTKRGFLAAPLFAFLFPTVALAQANPANVEELINTAAGAREVDDVPRAIKLYQQITEIDPQWPDGWWYLGSLQYDAGEYKEGRDALSRYIELRPNSAPAFAMRGLCQFETGDYEMSLKDLERGLALGAANQSRNEKILRYHEALLQTRLGRFGDALHSYAFFIHEEGNPDLLVGLGLAGLRTPLLPKEVKADQLPLFSSVGKAALDFMKGDKDGSRAEFEDVFKRFPATVNVHYLYGYLLYPTDADGGMAQFKEELDVAPSNAIAAAVLAWVLVLQNRDSEALPYAQKAVTWDPENPSAQLALGRALSQTGDTKSGIEHLEHALSLQPDNLEVHLALARAYSESGRKEDARRERLLSLEMTRNDTTPTVRP